MQNPAQETASEKKLNITVQLQGDEVDLFERTHSRFKIRARAEIARMMMIERMEQIDQADKPAQPNGEVAA